MELCAPQQIHMLKSKPPGLCLETESYGDNMQNATAVGPIQWDYHPYKRKEVGAQSPETGHVGAHGEDGTPRGGGSGQVDPAST